MRAVVLVMDSFGLGASADAAQFGDSGANTFLHIAQACAEGLCEDGRSGPLHLPNLQLMGLVDAAEASCGQRARMREEFAPQEAAWGFAIEQSQAKDTTSGHWEMMGQPVLMPWGYFADKHDSFPPPLVDELCYQIGMAGILGNCHASGTEIINRLGAQHLATGMPICYTSADSVFQIAYHEDIWSARQADQACKIARRILDKYRIARVIARPFCGNAADGFIRTKNRRDYSMPPQGDTLLDALKQSHGEVIGVGKISDIFAARGITQSLPAYGIDGLMTTTQRAYLSAGERSLIFTNLVDFDTEYGHRRNVNGYARALEQFDARLGELLAVLEPDDVLMISADHGCDPTFHGSDHTREHVPLLLRGPVPEGFIGGRQSFADIGQTLASLFELAPLATGISLAGAAV